jgi:hypothetical protein
MSMYGAKMRISGRRLEPLKARRQQVTIPAILDAARRMKRDAVRNHRVTDLLVLVRDDVSALTNDGRDLTAAP